MLYLNTSPSSISKIAQSTQETSLALFRFFECNCIHILQSFSISQTLAPNLPNLLNSNHVLNTLILLYNTPVDPGGTSQVPAQATTAVHMQLRYENVEACCIQDNNNNMENSLHTMVLEEVYSTHIFPLHNFFTIFMRSFTKYIMDNFMTRCRLIVAADIKQNKKDLQELLNTSQ